MSLSPESAASFGRLMAGHLWQSTGFAAVAVLLALALRANHAKVRYWLWLVASVKFLVPFSALAALGAGIGRWFGPATPVSRLPLVVTQIVQPFASIPDASSTAAPHAPNPPPVLLLALWLCGLATVLMYAWMRWRRVAAAVRSSAPLAEGRELKVWRRMAPRPRGIRIVCSDAKLEPGVLGVFHPVLWLPAGIGDRLEDAELEAVLAHELCHIRRRDNLLAAFHMVVEALFWFHPLVWWLGVRLAEERERACDEEVVRNGGEPQIYAESILKVCEFYLASPLACAAGVTGGELKKRIEDIMMSRFTRELTLGRKLLLSFMAIAATVAPISVGLLSPWRGRAQEQSAGTGLPRFELASVKPGRTNGPFSSDTLPGGRFTATNYSLDMLIRTAFGVEDYQVAGVPGKLGAEPYNIDAKTAGPHPQRLGREEEQQLLQALLLDRFALSFHRETRDMPLYSLIVAKNGPRLVEHTGPGSPSLNANDGSIIGRKTTLANLAWGIRRLLHRPVTDNTGIKGEFDFDLKWTPEQTATATLDLDVGADLFSALQEQLGLKLESRKGSVEVIVVDHIERPTPN